MRSLMPVNIYSEDSDSNSVVDVVEEKLDHAGMRRSGSNSKGDKEKWKGKGELKRQESFGWLLDEPSS